MAAAKFLGRAALLALLPFAANAAILPEDRTDVMYHVYDGGGLEVSGPSILVRKGIKDKVSVWHARQTSSSGPELGCPAPAGTVA